ncbi:unnamed protein product [Rhizophagus irregularis]|nr:unnamed protein product [Rhizophagus irregularis]
MSLSLDDATTSNDPMSIGSLFVNEEISIDPQESTSSSENLSIFSSKRRKRSRYNTYLERDTQMQNINNSDDNNDSNEETDNYGDSDDGDDSDDNDDGDDSDDNDDGDDGDDNDDGDDSDNGDDGDNNGEETNIFEDYSPPNYDFPNNINENLQNIDDWIIVFVLRFSYFVVYCKKEIRIEASICQIFPIKKCGHVQFPNHRSLRQCNAPLSEQKELDDGQTLKKILNYGPIEASTTESYVMYMMVKFGRISQIVE